MEIRSRPSVRSEVNRGNKSPDALPVAIVTKLPRVAPQLGLSLEALGARGGVKGLDWRWAVVQKYLTSIVIQMAVCVCVYKCV